MRKRTCWVAVALALCCLQVQANWEAIQRPDWKNDYRDAVFLDYRLGWVVGRQGTIAHTKDGGFTWQAQQSNVAHDLHSITMQDKQLWVVGAHGTILHSQDQSSWEVQKSGLQSDLFGVFFINAQQGWAVGDSGRILHTETRDSVWTPLMSGVEVALRDVYFLDEDNGWVVGDRGVILQTQNGGQTWVDRSEASIIDDYQKVVFAPSVDAELGMGYGWIIGSGGSILQTIDRGDTWFEQFSEANEGFYDMDFLYMYNS